MSASVSIKTPESRFNIKHVLLIIAFVVTSFVVSNYFAVEQAAENTPDLSIEDIEGIAEEIYTTGEVSELIDNLPIDAGLTKKMQAEIERILSKTADHPGCEVYYLRATESNNYPVLGYGDAVIGYEYMNIGDVWKVGITEKGQNGRYPNDVFYKSNKNDMLLNREHLEYQPIYTGTYKQVLILEKLLIYTYPVWSGHNLIKPPGCKIFR